MPTSLEQHAPPPPQPNTGNAPTLQKRLPDMRSPLAFKYKLDDISWPPQDVGPAIVVLKMTGDLVLMTKRAYPIVNINQRMDIEAQFVTSANHALGKLVQDTRFIYDPSSKRVTARSMLVSQSRTPGAPAWAIGSEISSNSPLPKLRAEIRLPKLEGSIDVFQYTAVDVKIVLEITPKLQRPLPPSGPSAVRIPIAPTVPVQPRAAPVTADDFDTWVFVAGAGLTATAVGIVAATLVEDFLTGFVGVADDPPSFALASSALATGLAMMGVGSNQSLPRAEKAALLPAKTTLTVGPRL